MDVVLDVHDVSKTFGVTRALSGVSLDIRRGEVHGILGRNGAGKSTLVSALSGLVRPDSGTITIDGAQAYGPNGGDSSLFESVAMVHQTPALVDSLSVAENLHLEPSRLSGRSGFIRWKTINDHAADLLDQWHLQLDPRQPVSGLGPAERHMLAIARAMARAATVIILDEPTAALPAAEINQLFGKLRELRDQGMAFIYISHHLEEVVSVCDRATVLRDGRVVATRDQGDLDIVDLVGLVAGRQLAAIERTSNATTEKTEPLLRVNNARPIPASTGVSFELRGGEVLALTGLLGSGAEKLAEIIAGATVPYSGQVVFLDRPIRFGDRTANVECGIGYVPADRHADGYVGILSVRENTSLSAMRKVTGAWGFVDSKREVRLADSAIADYGIKVSNREQAVESLSGGNQQKVVIARALATDPKLLIAVHPTRGVDVGAKESIYTLLRAFAAEGNAILLVTDELAEVDALANRVIVMRRGDAVATFDEWSHDDLLLSMEGTAKHA
jgi:ABC-type sugar transport system ATPase subunit